MYYFNSIKIKIFYVNKIHEQKQYIGKNLQKI